MTDAVEQPALLSVCALPANAGFIDAVADAFLGRIGAASDLSGQLILVSSLPLAAELRSSIAQRAGRPLLLPVIDTLRRWASAVALPEGSGIPVIPLPLPESERLVLLHEALRARDWFEEGSLWGIAAELAALSDELSEANVGLPESEAQLIAQLESAYRLRALRPLAFEARVVHDMWHVLAACGRPDAPSAYRMRLARLSAEASRPLTLVLDAPPEERLNPAEREFLERYAQRQPVLVCQPQLREAGPDALARTLVAAWPQAPGSASLIERAAQLRVEEPASPLAGRLSFVATIGREAEAKAVAAQVCAWLAAGRRRIALIAEDRLTARRVRALLERQSVLVADETGWKLSTTRAAATLDALLETVASEAYHLDVLDLFKSPFLFADIPESARAQAVLALEQAIRSAGVRSGLRAFRHALAGREQEDGGLAMQLLDRLEQAHALLGGKAASLPRWLARLQRALDMLAAADGLRTDAAGAELFALLDQRQTELAGSNAVFSFSAWREWLNRELEQGSFRDRSIASPVIMLPRHDTRLRRFDAAIVIGADAARLRIAGEGCFFNQAVRRELGLPTPEIAECALLRDLELLLSVVPEVVVSWQREQDGEALRLAAPLDLLVTLHTLAWGGDLRAAALPYPDAAGRAEATAILPVRPSRAAPEAPRQQLPLRISVSALAALIACPYRFFARHVLGLCELDEVTETLEKQDYGQLVHRSLERFHTRVPRLADVDDAVAFAILNEIVIDVFAAAEADNWLALGWRLRWQSRLADYLDWQRRREAAGWHWQAAEVSVSRRLPLADGAEVELYGRIDRIDVRDASDFSDAARSLLDYKTRKRGDLRRQLVDDVQLPAYALMVDGVEEAAYVALDDAQIDSVPCSEHLAEAASAQGERLQHVLSALRAGAGMPAHGSEAVCRYCEMAGLCRREHVDG